MTIQGTFKDGLVVLDQPANIPDGTKVEILVVNALPLSEALAPFAGSIRGPKDFARNHDHYIHGTPKK